MTTTLSLTVTEDGLRLPRQLFPRLGEVEVIERRDYILIKPKPQTTSGNDLRSRALVLLSEAELVFVPTWSQPPSTSPAERAELARKLNVGRPLSAIIIEERTERA